MTELLTAFIRSMIACNWCGNVRNKKVSVSGSDGKKLIVCRRHFEERGGTIVNDETIKAIVHLWETRDTQ